MLRTIPIRLGCLNSSSTVVASWNCMHADKFLFSLKFLPLLPAITTTTDDLNCSPSPQITYMRIKTSVIREPLLKPQRTMCKVVVFTAVGSVVTTVLDEWHESMWWGSMWGSVGCWLKEKDKDATKVVKGNVCVFINWTEDTAERWPWLYKWWVETVLWW